MVAATLARPGLPAGPITNLDYGGASIRMLTRTDWERAWRVHACAKEPWTVAWLEAMAPGDILWDLGANVGPYTLIAASRGHIVVAVEPGYANYHALCGNIRLNPACAPKIIPLPVAVGASVGVQSFAYASVDAGAASHSLGGDVANEIFRHPVLSLTVDVLIEDYGLPVPTHIKLDVDGGEKAVIIGMAQSLKAPTFRSLLIETRRDQERVIGDRLIGMGLRQAQRHDMRRGLPIAGVLYAVWERP